MLKSLSDSMKSRFHKIEGHHILAEAAGLDPRFKRMAFPDGRAADEAFQRLTTTAARLIRPDHQQEPAEGAAGGAGSGAASVVWSYFHEEVQ